MKIKKVKRGFHRGLATGLLVSVSMTLPATLLAAPKVEHASIVSVASQGNSEIAPSAASLPSSSQGDEGSVSAEVGANRRADLFDAETNSGLPSLDSDHRRKSSTATASAARFDSERKRPARRRVAAGTLGGLRILQRVLANGQSGVAWVSCSSDVKRLSRSATKRR